MELLLIGREKLKIILTSEDMNGFNLTCESIDYDNTETRRAFWCILDEAKHKTGFDAAADRVLIQLYPIRSGGCEMYVTKVSGALPDRKLSLIKSPEYENIRTFIEFDSLDMLLSACKAFNNSLCADTIESSAYFGINGKYYLSAVLGAQSGDYLHIFCEFGRKLSKDFAVSEKLDCICSEKAIETLEKLC